MTFSCGWSAPLEDSEADEGWQLWKIGVTKGSAGGLLAKTRRCLAFLLLNAAPGLFKPNGEADVDEEDEPGDGSGSWALGMGSLRGLFLFVNIPFGRRRALAPLCGVIFTSALPIRNSPNVDFKWSTGRPGNCRWRVVDCESIDSLRPNKNGALEAFIPNGNCVEAPTFGFTGASVVGFRESNALVLRIEEDPAAVNSAVLVFPNTNGKLVAAFGAGGGPGSVAAGC
ncbi:hypothetical protein BBJ28_00014373 [Nothophytophthora sp. Chile5]|nr:hypothetical protein BBJ28_00014373 [Nothophytophthora sp. Chile5]